MKGHDPFEEDRAVMSRGPVSDYSFVLHKWKPIEDFPFTTEWDEVGGEIEFRVTVRTFGGPVRAVVRMPRLETTEGKAAFTATVRDRLMKGLETK